MSIPGGLGYPPLRRPRQRILLSDAVAGSILFLALGARWRSHGSSSQALTVADRVLLRLQLWHRLSERGSVLITPLYSVAYNIGLLKFDRTLFLFVCLEWGRTSFL